MSAAAKGCSGPTYPWATASTRARTAAPRGATSDSPTASRSRPSSSIRATPTGCWSPCSAIRTGRTPSAVCTARPTGARRGSACSPRTRTPGRWTSPSIRRTRRPCSPCCGRRARRPGKSGVPGPCRRRMASTNRRTAAPRGASSAPGSPVRQTVSAASASPPRPARPLGCMPWSAPRAAAACTARTTVASTGSSPTPTSGCGAATVTSTKSRSIPKTPTSSTWRMW